MPNDTLSPLRASLAFRLLLPAEINKGILANVERNQMLLKPIPLLPLLLPDPAETVFSIAISNPTAVTTIPPLKHTIATVFFV